MKCMIKTKREKCLEIKNTKTSRKPNLQTAYYQNWHEVGLNHHHSTYSVVIGSSENGVLSLIAPGGGKPP